MHPLELTAFLALVGALFATAEWLRRRGVSAVATRRYTHAVGACAASALPVFLSPGECVALGIALSATLGLTFSRGILLSVHGVPRRTLGAMVFPASLAASAVIAWDAKVAYMVSAIVFALADPAASIVGERVNSRTWSVPGARKSLAGSVAFVVTTTLVGAAALALGLPTGPLAIVTIAAALGAVEAGLGFGLDNVALPLIATLLFRAAIGR